MNGIGSHCSSKELVNMVSVCRGPAPGQLLLLLSLKGWRMVTGGWKFGEVTEDTED